jgi:hypothetical protein
MRIRLREQTEYVLSIRVNQEEADELTTLLYRASNDLVISKNQHLLANSLIAALNGYKTAIGGEGREIEL